MPDYADDSVITPPLSEVLRQALESFGAELRVCLPARVEDYDAATGTVSVVPMVGEYLLADDGSEVVERLPVVPGVPVAWPGAGGARLTFPLQRGDTGELSFHDRALDEWKQAPNRDVVARMQRTHHLADATFRPGLRSPADPWKGARTDAVTLGYDGTKAGGTMTIHITPTSISLGEQDPDYAVALAEKVKDELSALRDTVNAFVSTFNTHGHVIAGATTGPLPPPAVGFTVGGTSAAPTAPAVPPSIVGDMGSTTVKTKG